MRSEAEPPTYRGELSVVIPVFNEAENLEGLYQKLTRTLEARPDYELIFVDDGSQDGSFEILRQLHDKDGKVKVIQFRRNFGKSVAYMAGFKEAEGNVVITMDGDLQDDPAEIPKFLDKIDEGFDLVNGWKYKGKGRRSLSSWVFNFVVSRMSGLKLHDFNCPFKAYRKEVVKDLKIYGELYRFIPALVWWQGWQVGELKIENYPRKFGKSKYGLERFWRGFFDLLTVLFLSRYTRRPLHLFGGVGAIFFILGFAIEAYLTVLKIGFGQLIHLRYPLFFLGILLMIVGAQFVSIGLLGEMLASSSQQEELYTIKKIL